VMVCGKGEAQLGLILNLALGASTSPAAEPGTLPKVEINRL